MNDNIAKTLEDLPKRKSSKTTNLFNLPDPKCELGRVFTDILQHIDNRGEVRWGLVEAAFIAWANIEKRTANTHIKHLVDQGVLSCTRKNRYTYVSLTDLGRDTLRRRNNGLNFPIESKRKFRTYY